MSIWDWLHERRKNLAYAALATALGAGLWSLSPNNPDFSKYPPAVQEAIKKEHSTLNPRFDEIKNQIIRKDFELAHRNLEEVRKSIRSIKSTGFPVTVALNEIALLDNCNEVAEKLAKSRVDYEKHVSTYLKTLDKEDLKTAMADNLNAMKYSNELLNIARTNVFSLAEKQGFYGLVTESMHAVSKNQVEVMATFSFSNLKFSKDDANILMREVNGHMKSTHMYWQQSRRV